MKTNRTSILSIVTLAIIGPGLSLYAQPGSGILLSDSTVLTPSATFTVNHTDNANLSARSQGEVIGDGTLSNANADTYFTQGVALDLNSQGGAFQWSAHTWLTNTSYDQYNDLDNETYGASLSGWASSEGGTSLNITLDWQHAVEASEVFEGINDELISDVQVVSQRSERDEYNSKISLRREITHKMNGSIGYGYRYTDFEDDTFRDFSEQNVSGRISYSLTKSVAIYFATGSKYIDQDKSSAEDLEYFTGWEDPYYTLGIDADRPFQLTDKISFNISAGYVTASRVSQDGSRETESEGTVALAGDMTYAISPKTSFRISARNGYETESTPGSSIRETTSVEASLSNQITNRLTHRVSAGWRKDDYLDPLPTSSGLVDEEKETTIYRYNINYTTARPWLSLFGSASYEDGNSQIDGETYGETLLSAGLALRY